MKSQQVLRTLLLGIAVLLTVTAPLCGVIADDADAKETLKADSAYYDGQYFCLEFKSGITGDFEVKITDTGGQSVMDSIQVSYNNNDKVSFVPDADAKVTPGTYALTMVSTNLVVMESIPVSGISDVRIILNGEVVDRVSIEGGREPQLAALVSPDNAYTKSVVWSSKDTSVVTVDSEGKLTAHSTGTARVTATCPGGMYAECTVEVTGIAPPEPEGSGDSTLLFAGIGAGAAILVVLLLVLRKRA